MKKVTLYVIFILGFNQYLLAQDSYKKRYYVKDSIEYKENIYSNEGEIIKKHSILGLKSQKKIDSVVLKIAKNKGLKSNVAFGKDSSPKLFVNPWLVENKNGDYVDRNQLYFYELENRQSLKIDFKEWSFNTLTVPLKVRFSNNNTEFSTDANLGALIGHSWGSTNFVHRKEKQIGNKEYDSKFTTGIFFGFEELEFEFNDSENNEIEIETALLSIGTGLLYSYEKFTFGVMGGFDFGLGKNTSEWEFQGKPWLGFSLGYSLFSF